ncbi:MAG: hypothetical protein ACT4PL_08430 [Phycisphaerales bacterium]
MTPTLFADSSAARTTHRSRVTSRRFPVEVSAGAHHRVARPTNATAAPAPVGVVRTRPARVHTQYASVLDLALDRLIDRAATDLHTSRRGS